MIFKKNVFTILIFLIFSSCGYKLGLGDSLLSNKTLSIPYVEGDFDGALTDAIIKEVSSSSHIIYSDSCAEYVLKVSVIDYFEDNIGFRYDRKKYGQIKKSIIPIETRANLIAQTELIESATGCRILGPVNIKASVDFDHDYYSSRNGVNIFSLGQLSDIDSAEEAVRKPLNRLLAEKIADFLNNAW